MRFILLAHQRTGTTLFRSLVNQHPKLYLYNEALFPSFFKWGWYAHLAAAIQKDSNVLLPTKVGKELVKYLDTITEKKENNGKRMVGVDIKIPQAELIRDFHKQVKGAAYGVLHLRRRNTLAAIVSHRTMTDRKKRGDPVHGSQTVENEKIMLDLDWLALRMQAFEHQDRMVHGLHKSGHYLELYYEDFSDPANWPEICKLLSRFFDTPFKVEFETTLRKQNSSNLVDLIRNVDDVRRVYPHFFEEQVSRVVEAGAAPLPAAAADSLPERPKRAAKVGR